MTPAAQWTAMLSWAPRVTHPAAVLAVAATLLLPACEGTQSANIAPTTPAKACPAPADATGDAANTPPARGYHQLMTLGTNLGVVALGGETAPPPAGGHVLMDLWGYRQASGWVQLAKDTPRTSDGPAAFDVQSNRLIVLGAGDADFKPAAENWVYDPSSDRWAKKGPGGRPNLGNADFTMAYDAESDRAILLTERGETWVYDLDRDAWTQKAPKSPTPALTWSAITYDQGEDRVVLFGGVAAASGRETAETWTYDYNTDTWKSMAPTKSPAARKYSYMAYDPKSHRTILFAGVAGPQKREKPFCDTWAYDLAKNTWTQLSAGVTPSARGWHAMAYDAAIGKIVLFGGGADRDHFQNDTWLFDSTTNTWSRGS